MEMRDLISVIDKLQNTSDPVVILESKNLLSQYIELEERTHFHQTGKSSAFNHHLKQSHGLPNSIMRSSSHGAKHFLKDEANPVDTVSMDIPLLIRLFEYAREDAQTDMDLHNVAERLVNLSKEGESLTMDDYDSIVDNSADDTQVMAK
jgi:hypothetical protein